MITDEEFQRWRMNAQLANYQKRFMERLVDSINQTQRAEQRQLAANKRLAEVEKRISHLLAELSQL